MISFKIYTFHQDLGDINKREYETRIYHLFYWAAFWKMFYSPSPKNHVSAASVTLKRYSQQKRVNFKKLFHRKWHRIQIADFTLKCKYKLE